jgi:cytochrome c553
LHSFATICVFGAALAAVLPACSSSDDPPGGSAGAAPTAGSGSSAAGSSAAGSSAAGSSAAGSSSAGTGDAAKGNTLYGTQCLSCHGVGATGNQGPNITMSMTAGIGSWTYQNFHDAVRLAKDKDGTDLCIFMSKFAEKDVSETGMQDLYAYLKSLPISDTKNEGTFVTGGSCP